MLIVTNQPSNTIFNFAEAINPSFCDWSHVETKILPKLETSLSTSSKIGVIRPSHQSGRRVSSSGCSTSKASKAATSTNKPSSRSSQNQEPSFQMKQNGNFEVNAELFSSPIDCRNFIKEYRERKLIKLREKVGEIAYVNWGLDLKLAKSDTFV